MYIYALVLLWYLSLHFLKVIYALKHAWKIELLALLAHTILHSSIKPFLCQPLHRIIMSLITLAPASISVKNSAIAMPHMRWFSNYKHVLNCVTFSGSISLSHFIPCTDLVGGAGTWSLQSDVCFSGVSLFWDSLTGDIDTVVEYGDSFQGEWRTPWHYHTVFTGCIVYICGSLQQTWRLITTLFNSPTDF